MNGINVIIIFSVTEFKECKNVWFNHSKLWIRSLFNKINRYKHVNEDGTIT